ncbi:MAG: hypothetical protein PHX68_04860 [Alphaproteobacteria bacterium]|nr:hypothetical protein [Alphaproteobacteria bacterium]
MPKKSSIFFTPDSSRFFLVWITGVMAFVITLVIYGGGAAYSSLTAWQRSISGAATLQIPTYDDKGMSRADAIEQDVETALTILRASNGISGAELVPDDQMGRLMSPWVGEGAILSELPLPKLLNISVDTRNPPDFVQLKRDLADQVPLAVLDTHRIGLAPLLSVAGGVLHLIVFLLILLGLTTTFTIVYATRTSLAAHQPVIALIHLMGAGDFYLTRQYAVRHLKTAFAGAAAGVLCAVPILWGISAFVRHCAPEFIVATTSWHWAGLLLIPPVFAGLAFVTTFKTVLTYLKTFL